MSSSELSLINGLLNADDSLERENEKLKVIINKLMMRVESASSDRAQGYVHFERAITLESEVQTRTHKLEEALDILHATNVKLAQTQNEAENARRNLQTAVEAIPEGFAVFDSYGILIIRNSRFSALFADVASEIKLGISFESYLRLSIKSQYVVLPDGMSSEDWLQKRLEAHAVNSVNFTLQLKDGIWLQISEKRTPDGGTIVLQTDITDHVRMELEEREKILDQQAKIVKGTLEHIEQGTLIFDSTNKLVEWNSAAIEILKLPLRLMKTGTRLARFEEIFKPQVIFTKKSDPVSVFNWANQSQTREVLRCELEGMNRQQYDVLGREMDGGSFLISFNNITQLRRAYEDLHRVNETLEQRVHERTEELRTARDIAQRANASKSRFVAAASHDLLQPINAAKLFISSLEHTNLDEKQAHTVARISQSFQSAESILGALLDISKLDSGKASLNLASIPLGPIFEALHNEYKHLAASKGITLRIIPTKVVVYSDPVYLRRILQNLVSNAIRYTQTGRVVIGLRRKRDQVVAWVIDTGVGIAPQDQEKVFQEFHRVNASQVDTPQADATAMGLGLAIVERACIALDHQLSLTSTLGEGTSVSVALPYSKEFVNIPQSTTKETLTDSSLKNTIIMVIENDLVVREATENLLEVWGASPLGAGSYKEAHNRIHELGLVPDVFLIDQHLDNDENGLEIIECLRKEFGPILAVLLTADRSGEIEEDAKGRGVFIRYKPLDILDLHELLSQLLASSRIEDTAPL